MKQDRSLITVAGGILLCCLGLFVLAGWILGNQSMVRIIPGSVAMSINTALMFFVAGACLLLKWRSLQHGLLFRGGAWFILILAGAILCEHVFDIDLHIDLAAVHDALGDGHAKPGRTAPNACAGFLLAALVMHLSAARSPSRLKSRAAMVLATTVFLIGFAAFLGYVLPLDAMYQIATYNRMATFTALGMTVLGVGLWTLAPAALSPAQQHARDDAQRITKLAAALLIVFAIATGLTSFGVMRDSFEHAATESHRNSAKSAAFTVASLLDQVALLSSALARRPALTGALEQLERNPSDLRARAELTHAAQVLAATGFSAARILAADGSVILASGSMTPGTRSMQVTFGAPADAANVRWNQGFVIQNEHRIESGGRLVATIITEHRLARLDAFLDQSRGATASTDLLLCTRDGVSVLCFPSRLYPQGAKLPMFKRDGSPALPIARALLGQSGAISAKDPRGVSVLAGYAPVAQHKLGIVVRTNTMELYQPLRDKLHLLALAVLVFVVLGVLLLRRWLQPLVAQIVMEQQRIKAILDNSNDAFIAVGPDNKITDWNKQAEKTLGVAPSDAIGQDLSTLIIPARQRHAHNGAFGHFNATGTGPVINTRVEVTAMHANGKEVPVELSVTAVKIGARYGASAFLRDLTERKAAEASAAEHAIALEQARQALTQSQKLEAVGKLTGGVAHDFNNVLQVVKGSLELLRQENKDAYSVMRRVDTAAGAVERGAKLASQLLAFARKQPLQPKSTSLGRVVRSMEEMLQRALGDGIEIEIAVGGALWNTLIDPNQLEHVILNLAINARDAMEGQGKLTIEVANANLDDEYLRFAPELQAGQFALLAISDTGSGMSPETMQRAFEPFFSTKPEGQGTGLGLSMAYGFVKQSGGHIKIYSEPGHGTTVRIYLPRSFEAEQHSPAPLSHTVAGGSETILVVEDDPAVQATVVDLLTGLGYSVLKADHAAMALDMLEAGARIDLLFTDVVMPGELRSPELARRAQALLPDVRVLFTSGYTQNAIVHGGRLDPGVHLLSKPYGREQLGRKVRSLLDAPAQPGVQAAIAAPQAQDGLRVAFVEDNDDFRLLGAELIAAIGYQAVCFASAEEALERVCAGQFDVLLTDVGLPGMSGTDLASAVHAAAPGTGIIIASGYGDNLQERPAFPFQVLPKPFTIEQLQACLAAAVPAAKTLRCSNAAQSG